MQSSNSHEGREEEKAEDGAPPGYKPLWQRRRDRNAPVETEPLRVRAQNLWAKTGITTRVYQSMFKGALAPTIAIAAFQARAWAMHFTTIGYLVGVMAVLAVVIQPRAKFVQTMVVLILMACIGAAFALLACYSCVRARYGSGGSREPGEGGEGTSGLAAQGAATSVYNSSASVVAGVWLFAEVYAISILRARMPQYTVPCIAWAIMANVSLVYAPQFSTIGQARVFVEKLLQAFFTGFGIAVGVSLLIFPLTSRQTTFRDMEAYVDGLRTALKANMTYLNSLERTDMFAAQRTNTWGEKPLRSTEAEGFRESIAALNKLQSKLHTDLPYAKREVAVGKVGPDDLQAIFKHLRSISVPTIGLSCTNDIFERIAYERGWDRSVDFAYVEMSEVDTEDDRFRIQALNEWHELIRLLKEPFNEITNVIVDGLVHVLLTLSLCKRRWRKKKQADNERTTGDTPKPGESGFAEYFDKRSKEFLESKQLMLRGWCRLNGIELSDDFFTNPQADDYKAPPWFNVGHFTEPRMRLRRQLMVMLYIDFLLYNISRRTYNLILLADGLRSSGKLSKTRLVVPGYKRFRKWMRSAVLNEQDVRDDDSMDVNENAMSVSLGQAYKRKKNPEHLTPQNAWERYTDHLRKIPHFFASPASAFGFRVACATMTIAVVNFLRETQAFYTQERIFWAQIMITIGMSPTAGQSLRMFLFRIFGTLIAMFICWIAYYVVDGHAPGVIILLFIFLHLGPWLMIRYPTIAPISIIGQVTIVLIVGYELQVQQIGREIAESNGQAYYPIYILAPIRLATVCGGLLLAWIWTIWPYPITEHSQLRKSLGSSLYLLANYYSVVHETLRTRLIDGEGDITVKSSPGRRLEKARNKIFAKCSILLAGLGTQARFVKYDIPVGGRFPAQQYQDILTRMQSALNYMALISVASGTFSNLQARSNDESASEWLRNLRRLMNEANLTSQNVTTLLSLLSASVSNGQALPPYLRVPEPYMLTKRLDELDADILSVRHIAEPGYASFAVIQLATKCVIDDLKMLLVGVKELVGELDFSYHVISTADDGGEGSEETLAQYHTARQEEREGNGKRD